MGRFWYKDPALDFDIGPFLTIAQARAHRDKSIAYHTKRPDSNIVQYDYEEGLWCFWDETWTHVHGPFASEFLANLALQKYVRYLNYGN